MSYATRDMEQSRLEIILLAGGVLVLVLFLGVFILVCVRIAHSNSPLKRHRTEAWGGSWNERWDTGPSPPGQDEGVFGNVRQHSVSIAGDVRNELTGLERLMASDMADHDVVSWQRCIENDVDSVRHNTTPGELDHHPSGHMLGDDVSNWYDLADSPGSSTGRDREGGIATKRPERAMVHGDSCDLEAQDSYDSEH
ncbi:uncharacterized protein MAM_02535 [Metarhizium album ARSEF 1941]|uniref:Uncharacterized protein n=1 Tax=Metarhizium album (strain ARSEF 1941) TaxID=1081103 RepID=A0A0B2X1U8_METAS|nr:uncharacterized protein MAM_02535 [Metarhizium album ARSEF 1941]KHN99682.1 hypothetical protein MAM_02535 [Metarhizium album ARSEF 1941]